MATQFDNIRLHREDGGNKSGSFYWDVMTGRRVSRSEVQKIAGKKHFFVPEQRKPGRPAQGETPYNEVIPDYGYQMTYRNFKGCVESGGFIDYDGFGYPFKDGKISNDVVKPSNHYYTVPLDADGVLWINR